MLWVPPQEYRDFSKLRVLTQDSCIILIISLLYDNLTSIIYFHHIDQLIFYNGEYKVYVIIDLNMIVKKYLF